ncbi:MAG: amino acid carrier protein [Clostridia bacterium]|nr:amino acid carrier protein [Clostridia bacterium]
MLQWLLTGGPIPVVLMLSGIFFLFYLRGYPWRAPKKMISSLSGGGEGESSSFRALMMALAGTLGVGNIVGVANALFIGGAGAVFWMWISALVAMILKYAEILLAVRHRQRDFGGRFFGGAVYYIKEHFLSKRKHRAAVFLSSLFAVFMIIDALAMGCVIQVNAVSSAVQGVLQLPPLFCALVLLLFTMPLLIKGSRDISALTEYLVPIMTGGYVVLSLAVLILRRDALGAAFSSIFSGAFSVESMGGGAFGFLTSKALRVGTMRGLLSNEAGCGTAPTAHASAAAKSPAAQGVWGIFEVFVDTILLCTATALVILVSGEDINAFGMDGVMLTIRAYSSVLGEFAGWFFLGAVFCFGYATVICWSGYGLENLKFLTTKKRWRRLYLLAVAVCIFFGAFAAPQSIWGISDFAITVLTLINITVLFLMRREIREETERWKGDQTP